jgi:hypothetical protein
MVSEDNYCIIYVWVPRDEQGRHVGSTTSVSGRSGVGHVAIQTKDFYGSFWPDWEIAAEGKTSLVTGGKQTITGGQLMDSYNTDKRNEQDDQGNPREADFKIVLYSLDVDQMKKAYDKFESRKGSYTWSLTGRGAFSRVIFGNNDGHSCASFVYDLLYHGGLFNKLNYNTDLARDIFIVNPNNMLKLSVNAKNDELKKFPQTSTFKKPFNSTVTVPTLKQIEPQVIAGGYCNVM